MMTPTCCGPSLLAFRASSAPIAPPGPRKAITPRQDGTAAFGTVVFLTHRKEYAEAILGSDGRWTCPKLPVLDRVLNALYAPPRNAPDGLPELLRVAAWLHGEVRDLPARIEG